MRLLLSKILYYFGNFIGKLICYNFISKYFARPLYAMYSSLMLSSMDLDQEGKVWNKK